MKLLNEMKMKTQSVVKSLYEFNTSQDPQSISRNASRAQALLAETTFIYQEFNFGGRPRHPHRHPIIQKVVNLTWFQNKYDIAIIHHQYFTPIPFEAIALVLTVVRSSFELLPWILTGCTRCRSSDRVLPRRVVYWHM
ncbi:hypothetical protein BGY98DRAFT_992533 [Russula aff. rugulosa BPL654]|nr:hypothetical protein BGY98DRAFT_992533 [Russula aff. rugulosa BPL654]